MLTVNKVRKMMKTTTPRIALISASVDVRAEARNYVENDTETQAKVLERAALAYGEAHRAVHPPKASAARAKLVDQAVGFALYLKDKLARDFHEGGQHAVAGDLENAAELLGQLVEEVTHG